MKEDRRPVLRADVWPLPVERGRVVHRPKCVEKFVITHTRRIECHLYHLGMAGRAGANVVIGRIFELASQVAGNCVEHSRDLAESLLHTPEAARAKCSFFSHSVLIINTDLGLCWMDSGLKSSGVRRATRVCYIVRHEI